MFLIDEKQVLLLMLRTTLDLGLADGFGSELSCWLSWVWFASCINMYIYICKLMLYLIISF